jgi:transposase
VTDICTLYLEAPRLAGRGERVVCGDELTGVQALERTHPDLPMQPGHVRRREFEDIRHGTCCFPLNRDVVTGRVICPTCGERRTEADYVAHVRRLVDSDPGVRRWHIVVDNLNIHQSASLVRYVAELSGRREELGVKGKSGILANQRTRAAFLSDPSHAVVFHYTPTHASWMNQIEIWLSILAKKVLKWGDFTSVADLKAKVLAFITYSNERLAKPFKWTYTGPAATE